MLKDHANLKELNYQTNKFHQKKQRDHLGFISKTSF